MPKFFCLSDVHGFYKEMRDALDNAGFDPNNKDHWLIGAGDYVDRGRQPQEVIDFLMSLDRCLLVKGNHTDLLMKCVDRGYPLSHDWHNGTAQTIIDLAPNAKTFDVACSVAYEKVKDFVDSMVNYVELKNHIIVHSFVPLKCNDKLPAHYIKNRKFEKMEKWREATNKEWQDARWGNPYQLAAQGFLPDKTLVFGHYHTSWPRCHYEGKPEFDEGADFSIYYGDGYIALDSCCVHSKKINVLVVKDEFLDD